VSAGDLWNAAYRTKTAREQSWFETTPATSLRLLRSAGLTADTCVIDVGGGDSRLVDGLLALGLRCLAVLDASGTALARARVRLGPAADTVRWIEANVTGTWSCPPVDIWHDRALFHFLTEARDRDAYLARLGTTLKPGGSAIIATFSLDGPKTCSGLPVARYSPQSLASELGRDFQLVESVLHDHRTPWGTRQPFQYSRLVRVSEDVSASSGGQED
jgi:SAM-dependent methyltransferase